MLFSYERVSMIELLSRLFVRGYENPKDTAVRARYGSMVAIVCIIANTLLSAAKFLAGILLGSIAITADAVKCFDYYGITACTVVKDI